MDRYDYELKVIGDFGDWDTKYTAKKRAQLWIMHAGEEVRAQLRKFTWEKPEDEYDLKKIKEKLIAKSRESGSLLLDREEFWRCTFAKGELFEAYFKRLLAKSEKCAFGASLNENLVQQIVRAYGPKDPNFQQMLIALDITDSGTLEKLKIMCKTHDMTKKTSQELGRGSASVDAMGARPGPSRQPTGGQASGGRRYKKGDKIPQCGRCDFVKGEHAWGYCPGFKVKCAHCDTKGHFTASCYKIKNKQPPKKKTKVDTVEDTSSDGDNDELMRDQVSSDEVVNLLIRKIQESVQNTRTWHENAVIQHATHDHGSSCNVI